MKITQNAKGDITIKITAAQIAHAAESLDTLAMYDESSGDHKPAIVWDKVLLAQAVCGELENEEEDGTTAVHNMLDNAIEDALEQGADGIAIFGEDISKGEYARREAERKKR